MSSQNSSQTQPISHNKSSTFLFDCRQHICGMWNTSSPGFIKPSHLHYYFLYRIRLFFTIDTVHKFHEQAKHFVMQIFKVRDYNK